MDKLQVVLASPSDLMEERKMVAEVVKECNAKYIKRGLSIDLRMWENSLPGSNDNGPQGLIDLDLEIPESDIFICMYWKKIGTLLPEENVTGTEHELNIALESYKKSKKPDIKAFFKKVPDDIEVSVDTVEIDRIADKLKSKGLYNVFANKEELEKTINRIFEEEFIKRKLTKNIQNSKAKDLMVVSEISDLVRNLKSKNRIYLPNGYYGILDFEEETDCVRKEDVFDGQEVVVDGLSDATIVGDDAVLLARARYADVIRFENCKNLRLENLTLGHTPQKAYCTGTVLCFNNCENIELVNLRLFGCGTYGIMATDSKDILLSGSRIFECTYGGVYVSSTEITIENTMIYDCNDVFSIISGSDDSTVMMENVAIYNNSVVGTLIDMEDSWLICRGVSVYDNSYRNLTNVDISYGISLEDNEVNGK